MQTLIHQVNGIQTALVNLQNQLHDSMTADRISYQTQFETLNQNVRRLGDNPVAMMRRAAGRNNNNDNNNRVGDDLGGGGGEGGMAVPPPLAELSPQPRTLHALWHEWQSGIGGRKAARLFTAQERGKQKSKFCRRKVVWDRVALLIRAGHSSQVLGQPSAPVAGHGKPSAPPVAGCSQPSAPPVAACEPTCCSGWQVCHVTQVHK